MPGGTDPVSVAIGDLNADGNPDLVTALTSAEVSVLLGNGDESFQTSVTFPTGGSYSVAIGDVNGDGRPDLVTANPFADDISVLLNTTSAPRDTTAPVVRTPGNLAVDATSPSGAIVHYTVTATDNIDPAPVVTSTPPPVRRSRSATRP